MQVRAIPTWKLEEILDSPHCTGVNGADYGPIKEELQNELWRRQEDDGHCQIKQYEKDELDYALFLEDEEVLKLVQEIEVESDKLAAQFEAEELPPPVPYEARMAWLQDIAIPKSELPKRAPTAQVAESYAARRNVWEGLPQNPPRQRAGLAYAPDYRFIYAKFDSTCHGCESDISRGDLICWYQRRKTVYCANCDEFRANNVERMMNGLPDIRGGHNVHAT